MWGWETRAWHSGLAPVEAAPGRGLRSSLQHLAGVPAAGPGLREALVELGSALNICPMTEVRPRSRSRKRPGVCPHGTGCPAREALAGLLLPDAHVPAGAVQAMDSEDMSEALCPVPGRGSKGRGELPPAVTGETQLSSSWAGLAAGGSFLPSPEG